MKKVYFVYVLKSQNHNRFYVGMTENMERRLREHNAGKTFSTKGYRPWKLFFTEAYPSRAEARKREKYLKSGYGKSWIREKWSYSSVGYLPARPSGEQTNQSGRQGATVTQGLK